MSDIRCDEIMTDNYQNGQEVEPENANMVSEKIDVNSEKNVRKSVIIVEQKIPEKGEYMVLERGTLNSMEYRIFLKNASGPISIFHDVPLYIDEKNDIHNMVVLAPRWSNAKMQIAIRETLHPIRQEHRKGTLRYISNCFPHHGYIWNVGILPQTWKNPELLDDGTGAKGDCMPMEVLEIGYRVAKRGEVLKVKVLGMVALMGEVSWKAVAIDTNDPLALKINDLNDVESECPGLLKATMEWFQIYQIPAGKRMNFRASWEVRPIQFARNVIAELHRYWKRLINNEVDTRSISRVNRSIEENSFQISKAEAEDTVNAVAPLAKPLPIPDMIEKWHYIHFDINDIF